jgi:hypothetical protein
VLKALMRIRSRQFIFFTLCPLLKLPAPSEFSSPVFFQSPRISLPIFSCPLNFSAGFENQRSQWPHSPHVRTQAKNHVEGEGIRRGPPTGRLNRKTKSVSTK